MGKAARFLLLLAGRIKPLLDQFSGAAAAYSLRSLSASTTNVVKVRRDSDGAELDFTASDISNGTLASWVNTDVQVMTNPEITSATGWTIGSFTTYNAFTEAFDLLNENGNTVRQSKAIAGLTYDITLVIDSFSSGGIKVYVGGTQSATISSAGTYNLTITAGSTNTILGLNPAPTASCSISSFYATQTISNGFVTTWYDQSGNGNNATQATAASQPKIVSSGSLITENGKAALDFDGSDDSLATASAVALTNQSIFAAIKLDTTITSASSPSRLWNNDAATADVFVFGAGTGTLTNERLSWLRASGGNVYGSGQTSSDISLGQYLYSAFFNTSPSTAIYQNGSILSLTDTSGGNGGGAFTNTIYPAGFQRIGNNSAGTTGFDGKVQEMIVYATDESANRTGIEANINDYYNIYP